MYASGLINTVQDQDHTKAYWRLSAALPFGNEYWPLPVSGKSFVAPATALNMKLAINTRPTPARPPPVCPTGQIARVLLLVVCLDSWLG